MIQELLSDRFDLHVHREATELTVYTLVIAKDGPKLKPGQMPGPATDGPSTQDREGLPLLFTALQEQLGLRLRSAKATVEVITIDSIGPPSGN